mmetsp:Transcript_37925/g.95327  ORF Transcript_37925/g.95327 Transcript_37925/m.95327 type:complete len:272 (-) Transcript_37925:174-989(-)
MRADGILHRLSHAQALTLTCYAKLLHVLDEKLVVLIEVVDDCAGRRHLIEASIFFRHATHSDALEHLCGRPSNEARPSVQHALHPRVLRIHVPAPRAPHVISHLPVVHAFECGPPPVAPREEELGCVVKRLHRPLNRRIVGRRWSAQNTQQLRTPRVQTGRVFRVKQHKVHPLVQLHHGRGVPQLFCLAERVEDEGAVAGKFVDTPPGRQAAVVGGVKWQRCVGGVERHEALSEELVAPRHDVAFEQVRKRRGGAGLEDIRHQRALAEVLL